MKLHKFENIARFPLFFQLIHRIGGGIFAGSETPRLPCRFRLEKLGKQVYSTSVLFANDKYGWESNLKREIVDMFPAVVLLSAMQRHITNMKKRGFVIFACVVLLAVIVFIGMHFFPSSPEGYVDLVEVVEIGTYTEDELRDKMLGKYRVDIDERWGESNKTESDADTDVYEFEDISYKVILTYDEDGQVIDLERIKIE